MRTSTLACRYKDLLWLKFAMAAAMVGPFALAAFTTIQQLRTPGTLIRIPATPLQISHPLASA
jgi:hypothetical protein